MGTDHVPDFLKVEALILLQTTRESEGRGGSEGGGSEGVRG